MTTQNLLLEAMPRLDGKSRVGTGKNQTVSTRAPKHDPDFLNVMI